MIDPAIAYLLCVAAAGVFITGAVGKWRERELFAAAMENYELIPSVAVPTASGLLIAGEFLIGGLLLVPQLRPWPQLAGVALLLLVTAAVTVNLLRGRDHISCGCGGASGDQNLSWALVARNVLFAGLIAWAATSTTGRQLVWLDYGVALAGAAMLAGLYAAASQLIANQPRLEALRNGT
jgi:hypothetical protein